MTGLLIVVALCLLLGWLSLNKLRGDTGAEAEGAANASPGKNTAGVLVFAAIFFVGFLILGLLVQAGVLR
jgi:hypothetical protein